MKKRQLQTRAFRQHNSDQCRQSANMPTKQEGAGYQQLMLLKQAWQMLAAKVGQLYHTGHPVNSKGPSFRQTSHPRIGASPIPQPTKCSPGTSASDEPSALGDLQAIVAKVTKILASCQGSNAEKLDTDAWTSFVIGLNFQDQADPPL